jgi:hypothetical protein
VTGPLGPRRAAAGGSGPARGPLASAELAGSGRATGEGRRVCYLHIGLHKTASSTIQQMVLGNIEPLAAAGIYVPETATGRYRRIHHELAQELNRLPAVPTTSFALLRAELRSRDLPGRVLLSSEDFSRRIHRSETREHLQTFFGSLGYRLRVIAYLRPQDRSFNSTYSQHVRALTLGAGFDDYWQRMLKENPPWFDYHRLLGPVLEDQGWDCELRPFNRAAVQAGIEQDFLAAIGVAPEQAAAFRRVEPVNRTPGPKTIAACREIARRLEADEFAPARMQRLSISRRLQRAAAALGWDEAQYSGLTPEAVAHIRAHYAQGNDLLSRQAWGKPWEEVFAHEFAQPVAPDEFDPATAAPTERAEFDRLVDETWGWATAEFAQDPGYRGAVGPSSSAIPPGQADRGDRPPPLKPILILWSGRSGSTLLMQLLGTSPLIAFDRVYPYEHPYLLYLVRMARLLERPTRPSEEWRRRDLRVPGGGLVGPFPARRVQILRFQDADPLWARSLRALWVEFSQQARAAMPSIVGKGAPPPTMYAEKCQDWVPTLLRKAGIEHHRLYLLRDPRDVYLSILAFNAKRGVQSGFGMKDEDTPETFARRFAAERRPRLEQVVSGEIPQEQVVRYDAMIADLDGEARRLGESLGVKLNAAAVRATERHQSRHITAGSVAASLDRWKREMTTEIQAIFSAELGELLAAVGWEV